MGLASDVGLLLHEGHARWTDVSFFFLTISRLLNASQALLHQFNCIIEHFSVALIVLQSETDDHCSLLFRIPRDNGTGNLCSV